MLLQKDHLLGHYTWTNETSHTIFTGKPTRRKFDRFNGDQVLFIINLYGSTLENFSVQEGQNLENLILNNLPLQASSEISVFNWLSNSQQQ
jgi:hypothetical protein